MSSNFVKVISKAENLRDTSTQPLSSILGEWQIFIEENN